ncbi:MAG TPA: glycosyltransferase family 39 protein [bacterium]
MAWHDPHRRPGVEAWLRDPARLTGLTLALGALLRVAFFQRNATPWGDESGLIYCELTASWAAVLRNGGDPMLMETPLYMLMLKACGSLFGNHPYAFRLPSLLAGLAALPVFARLAGRALTPWSALVATYLVAVSEPLIYYSANAKQYGFDVLAVVLLALMLLELRDQERDFPWSLWIAGLVSLLLSFEMIFICAGLGCFVLLDALWQGRWRRAAITAAWGSTWALVFIVQYLGHLRPVIESRALDLFWGSFNLPFPPHSLGDLVWYVTAALRFFRDPLDFPEALSVGMLAASGLLLLLRRSPAIALLLFSPLATYAVATVFQLAPVPTALQALSSPVAFPLMGRVILFALPLTLLFLASALDWLQLLPKRRLRLLGGGAAAALLLWWSVPAVTATYEPPPGPDVRALAEAMAPRLEPDDIVFVQMFGLVTVQLEWAQRGWGNSFRYAVIRDENFRADLRRDVASLQDGQRFWLITLYSDYYPQMQQEKDVLVHVFTRFSFRLDSVRAGRVEAELFQVVPGFEDGSPAECGSLG